MMEPDAAPDEKDDQVSEVLPVTPPPPTLPVDSSQFDLQSFSTPPSALAGDLMAMASNTRRKTIQNLWGHIKGKKPDTVVKPRSHYRRGTIFLQHLERQQIAKGGGDNKFFERIKSHYEHAHMSTSTMIGLSIFQNGVNPVDDPFIVDNMPLEIQIGFRRKLFELFSMQLLVVVGLIAAFSNIAGLKAPFVEFWPLVAIFAATIVLLFALYLKKYNYPTNFVVLGVYTVCMSVFLVGVDAYLGMHVSLFVFALTFVVMSVLGVLCTIKKADDTLYGYMPSVAVAFAVAFAVASLVYFTALRNVFSTTTFFMCCATILVLSFWFAYDASCMNQRLSPDEYMQGMIFFYTDMVMFVMFVGMVAFAFMACEGDVCCCGSAEIMPVYPLRGGGAAEDDENVQPDGHGEATPPSAVENEDIVDR
ncbi:hypothetical protein DYB25_013629 [Aphanomyces astaci]|uniref:Uncharacterized protein n=1 Tax=Aphanomyces astaci TaxID=112090 RepID=A0A397C329_APHAT|nr:hypothetical protein DYB36_014144 [Aphanomyces astaci]RHY30810.1 hypothetical protein DYB25_013629 [Aphanomyces astaci]RHZ10981.1 hypothetical protein DYB26_013210 [Aphanomyces astaci]